MKKSKVTEEQIAGILRETDREPDGVRRLKQPEQENARLTKPVTERHFDIKP